MNNYKSFLVCAITTFTISAFSIGAIGYIDLFPESQQTIVSYIVAAIFWSSVIVGIVLLFLCSGSLKEEKKSYYKTRTARRTAKIGLLTFRNKPISITAYAVFIVGALLLLIDGFFVRLPKTVFFPILALTVLAIIVHCVFDGENYKIYSHTKDGLSDGE